tara:strand:+ start:5624 stop:6127 length:504 start_codon:yes stop_codon:yes gene_type:complete
MKLFVAKLNREAVESDLLEWFGAMGAVKSVKIVTDRETGQSKCFGFVEMEDKEAGQRAISEMNGQEYMEFRMVVKEAEERGARPSRPPQGSSAGASGGRSFGSSEGSSTAPRSAGGGFSKDKKPALKKKKVQKSKPDKYSDGPRQTKMKKPRGGGGFKGWSDEDEEF